MIFSEAATWGVLWKKLFLQNFLIFTGKLQACNFIKQRLQRRCSPLNIAEFLRTSILLTAASDFLKQLQKSGKQLRLYWLFFQLQIIYEQ